MKYFNLLTLLVCLTTVMQAQITVSEVVVNYKNQPLSGVQVYIAGGNSTVSTNAEGHYSITAKPWDAIRFTAGLNTHFFVQDIVPKQQYNIQTDKVFLHEWLCTTPFKKCFRIDRRVVTEQQYIQAQKAQRIYRQRILEGESKENCFKEWYSEYDTVIDGYTKTGWAKLSKKHREAWKDFFCAPNERPKHSPFK